MADFRIAPALISRWLLLGGLLFPTAMAYSQASTPLPNAPRPATVANAPAQAQRRPEPRGTLKPRRWRPYVNPGEVTGPLSVRQKMMFWVHLETVPYAPIPSFIAAGFEQGINGNPKFGSDSGAFGERLGAAAVRDASMRFFVSSFFPALLHEDPRYYRMPQARILRRGLWAGEQALVTHTDAGRIRHNYSDLLGHLAASFLTIYYYPAVSANADDVTETWATSIAGDAGNNLLLEFIPSIMSRWRQHRLRRQSRSSQLRRSSSIP